LRRSFTETAKRAAGAEEHEHQVHPVDPDVVGDVEAGDPVHLVDELVAAGLPVVEDEGGEREDERRGRGRDRDRLQDPLEAARDEEKRERTRQGRQEDPGDDARHRHGQVAHSAKAVMSTTPAEKSIA
jgi:hypothetical protein